MMKNKIIILIISIMVIILFLLGSIIYIKINENNDIMDDKEEDNLTEESIQGVIKPIGNNTQLFTVQNYIQDFIEQINVNNVIYYTGGKKIEQSIISNWTYSLLSTEYIKKNSITEDNVYNYVNEIEEKLIFVPLKINMFECDNTTKYAIYGFTQTQTNEFKEDVYFILNVDNKNNTYSIEPVLNVKSIDDIEFTGDNLVIEKNRYNSYEEEELTDEDICEQYMIMYKRLMLSNSNEAYKYLDSEYRDIKYGSFQDYQNFIADNKDDINDLVMTAYAINEKQFVCKDDTNNYYIFNVNNVLDYTVILDTYTVDLPQFTEKYNKASEQEKVALNINKVITALNAKDYKYIYSKLADSFKNNYFKDEESLKEYLVNNLFDKNIVEFEKFSKEGMLYTYQVKITKIVSEEEQEKYYGKNAPMTYMNIVMQLNEGTDFVMSFSIEE